MFTEPSLVREILAKKEYIVGEENNVYAFVENLFDGALEREALQHSLRIEYPIVDALKSEADAAKYEKEVERLGENLKGAWEYGVSNFKMPLKEDFLIELAYQIEPRIFNENGKGYRKIGAMVSGSSIIRPYPSKIPVCMDRFFSALEILYKNCNALKRKGNSAHEKSFDLGAWMHLHLARVHPFEDVNGRTSRMINNLYLKHSNAFPPIIIHEGERRDYYNHLEDAFKGIRQRDGEMNGALVFGREEISEGEKRFYDFMAGKLNVALDNVIEGKKSS